MKHTRRTVVTTMLLAALCALAPGTALAGIGENAPLELSHTTGVVAVGLKPQDGGESVSGRRVGHPKRLREWMRTLLKKRFKGALGRAGSGGPALSFIDSKLKRIFDRRRGGASHAVEAALPLGFLGIAAEASVRGLQGDEALSLSLTLGERSYSADLSKRTLKTISETVTLQIDWTPLPAEGEVDGSLFAALVRISGVPTTGVLFVGVIDSTLRDTLEPYGITNTEQLDGKPVTIPFGVTLTAEASGDHTAEEPQFDAIYFSKQDVVGIAVPEALAEAAQEQVEGAK